jgi:hypothetical protein
MVGKTRGFVSYARAIAPGCTGSHCINSRQILAVKAIPNALKTVLDEAVFVANFIELRPLNSRTFTALRDKMDTSYTTPLLHTEVRCLQLSRILVPIFTQRSEIRLFCVDCHIQIL